MAKFDTDFGYLVSISDKEAEALWNYYRGEGCGEELSIIEMGELLDYFNGEFLRAVETLIQYSRDANSSYFTVNRDFVVHIIERDEYISVDESGFKYLCTGELRTYITEEMIEKAMKKYGNS